MWIESIIIVEQAENGVCGSNTEEGRKEGNFVVKWDVDFIIIKLGYLLDEGIRLSEVFIFLWEASGSCRAGTCG